MALLKTVARTSDGASIDEVTLESNVASVSFLTAGAATRDWRVSHIGREIPVVLSYDDPAVYLENPSYFGAIAGRVANRTAGGRFTLDGKSYQCTQNEGENMLHGGALGLARRLWAVELDTANNAARFTYHSADGEEGFPGAVDFTVTVSLNGAALTYEMEARSDQVTPINMAQHNYYNLMGEGTIWDHKLHLAANRYTPVDDALIPTGEILGVANSRFDFRQPTLIKDADSEKLGIDHNFVLEDSSPAAVLNAPNGLSLTLETEQPGLQVYTGAYLDNSVAGLNGREHVKHGGICLEPQTFPNALNQAGFEARFATPDEPYKQKLTVTIDEGRE
ncbi:galactose mutarotase [Halocynthiibacter sp. C4]|uniref:aldose epimerase family protein n=1 Tax=Halocynthiibacter sp. C4 TaxID=2992758 RepID=UPI00237A3524|nr:aldose epimerase family protein [Halocynthiibacter sp. C4]MDE0588605.1 galactose mutarotase [Halocynthiibacter sp. C4]